MCDVIAISTKNEGYACLTASRLYAFSKPIKTKTKFITFRLAPLLYIPAQLSRTPSWGIVFVKEFLSLIYGIFSTSSKTNSTGLILLLSIARHAFRTSIFTICPGVKLVYWLSITTFSTCLYVCCCIHVVLIGQ